MFGKAFFRTRKAVSPREIDFYSNSHFCSVKKPFLVQNSLSARALEMARTGAPTTKIAGHKKFYGYDC